MSPILFGGVLDLMRVDQNPSSAWGLVLPYSAWAVGWRLGARCDWLLHRVLSGRSRLELEPRYQEAVQQAKQIDHLLE